MFKKRLLAGNPYLVLHILFTYYNINMRNPIIVLLFSGLMACSAFKIDMKEAIACAEGHLQALQKSDFDAASAFYSNMYNDTESPERRLEKMQKLEEAMGKLVSYTLTDSVEVRKGAEVPTVELTYDVQHTRVKATYKFVILKDAGEYKIIRQYVETDNFSGK